MNAYPKELRLRVLDAVDRGLPRGEVSEVFGVSLSTIKRWVKRRRCGEALEPKRSTGRKRHLLSGAEEKHALWNQLQENDEATLERHCKLWEQERGVRVSLATMSRAGYTREAGVDLQEKTLGAAERDEEVRGAWKKRYGGVDPERLVFVDESSTNVRMVAAEGEGALGARGLMGKRPGTRRRT